jgi:hypothetical protein
MIPCNIIFGTTHTYKITAFKFKQQNDKKITTPHHKITIITRWGGSEVDEVNKDINT